MSATIINKMLVRAVYENDVCRVKELLQMGADPNYNYKKNGTSCNLLKACIQFNFAEVLVVLLENGISISPSLRNDLMKQLSYNEVELVSSIESIEAIKVSQLELTNRI